ncbi:hypothetical protein FRB94_002202 [Tulasnella sp. JGI-2019a]|nr:hypothetical protein FRB94_002202 [Tulasnella sp. JGI-2019a]
MPAREPARAGIIPQNLTPVPEPAPEPLPQRYPLRGDRMINYRVLNEGPLYKLRKQGVWEREGEETEVDEALKAQTKPVELPNQGGPKAKASMINNSTATEGLTDTLKNTSLIASVNYVYGVADSYYDWITSHEIGFDKAHAKAFGAATRLKDAPRSFKEAMSQPDADRWMEAA